MLVNVIVKILKMCVLQRFDQICVTPKFRVLCVSKFDDCNLDLQAEIVVYKKVLVPSILQCRYKEFIYIHKILLQ